ncbi:MAG: type I restriction endonuclease subunit R [Clostridiales bacterium]|jgi:type I restriction enzyme R subunit|nr:type I restriction endonuclease subunit R [Clostridiales bacterium]
MSQYNLVCCTTESTVVSAYTSNAPRSQAYQSEADLEREFIRILEGQGYEYVQFHNEKTLTNNLRVQLEVLNNIAFTDSEWERFFRECIASANDSIVQKTRKIQEDYIQILKRDDGSTKNICLLDKKNIHINRLQVINQYEETAGAHDTRYDVTVLVNGLPLVHIELKRRGVAIREAFNQIKRYQRDSFWAACGLYEYVQIFVISNGTNTKYYSNTTRSAHIKELGEGERGKSKKTSNSFEFTSFWADANNNVIADLVDFTQTFFAKHTLLNILTRYCVFTSEQLLLVMRPYQIAATEQILNRIKCSANYKKTGTTDAGGFIWHTTGSGKTLTSFKTAQLATVLEDIDKVLFVVDRKDLDYQTMKEYDKFAKGAANSNVSTRILEEQLTKPNGALLSVKGENNEQVTNRPIVVTTIQKLDNFVSKNKTHDIYKKHVVIIFDECHRSQFGDMHQKIIKAFRNYHIFGFTGTPIFPKNAVSAGKTLLRTTEQAFGEKLHTYTIVDAINDGNVLPFRIDFIDTVKIKDDVQEKQVRAIDIEKALNDGTRVAKVVEYILDHFDQKTKRNTFYSLKGQRTAGFNSIFAVSSIPMAMRYYTEFKKQLAEGNRKLAIATIYSYSANEDNSEDTLPDEQFNNENLDKTSRDFLEDAIKDYNATFNMNFDTSADKFQNYYKDLSERMKKREVDLLIVVNMFLTGFDATTLNTLWVDKNLKLHGLIQAYSRTNRILNSVKTFGNIVCFRDLKQATDDAIALFGDKESGGVVLLKTYNDYYNGYDLDGKYQPGYSQRVAEIIENFPLGEAVEGEEAQKEFIRLYGSILRLRNILTAFDDFAGNEILSERDFQDYQSVYIDLYQKLRPAEKGEKEIINDDIIFELELIKQIEVNIDYILMLVEKYHASNREDKTILSAINKAICSSMALRSKKELIDHFVEQVNVSAKVDGDWQNFVRERKEEELTALIAEEKLKDEETRRFIDTAFRDGTLKTTGTDIDKILPPVSRFGGGRDAKKQGIIEKLMTFFEKYMGLA